MDNFGNIAEIFGNGFFPVIMCVFLCFGGYKLFQYIMTEGKALIEKIEQTQKEETSRLADVITNNTTVAHEIVTELRGVENRLGKVEEKVDQIYIDEKKKE